ncbi:hypothetical protein D4R30_00390 [archaeon]|nr:MAG: hypothetical protein D4R30_00390 [archaeon]
MEELQADTAAALTQLAVLQAEINQFTEQYNQGIIGATEYRVQNGILVQTRDTLIARINSLQAQLAVLVRQEKTTAQAAAEELAKAAADKAAAQVAADAAADAAEAITIALAAARVKAAADAAARATADKVTADALAKAAADSATVSAEVANLTAQADVLHQRFTLGQIAEGMYLAQIAGIQARLKALNWPPWTPPAPPPIPVAPAVAPAVALDLDPMVDLMKNYGFLAPMMADGATKNGMQALLSGELTRAGVDSRALSEIHESPADPQAAGALATAVALGCVATMVALGSAGIIAESLSLGQIETVATVLMKIADAAGISGLGAALTMIPFETGLIAPARQHWLSVHRPSLPGSGDLIRFVVKEVLTPADFEKTMSFQGFSTRWTDAYWDAHWRDISVEQANEAYHKGILTREERDKYLVLLDYKPEARPGITKADRDIIAGLAKTPLPRVDVRRGFKLGDVSMEEMQEMYVGLGYEDKAPLMTKIQARAAYESLQNSVINEAMYMLSMDKITGADFEALFDQVRDTYDEKTLWVTRAQLRKVRMAKPPAEEGPAAPSETELEEALG